MIGFTTEQTKELKAKLDAKHVRVRQADGFELNYVEGWHVIAEANRIFGHDAWDRRTLASQCVWSGKSGGHHSVAYTAKVRVTVRAGDIKIVREGSGTGEGTAPSLGQAHDVALKGAETDATKRALATFGNPFGLALYDPTHLGVSKSRKKRVAVQNGPWVLRSADGADEASYDRPSEFVDALRKALDDAGNIERLFTTWEQNVDTVRALNRVLKQEQLTKSGVAPQLVAHLKRCAVALAGPKNKVEVQNDGETAHCVHSQAEQRKVDKSVLRFSEPKRIRSREPPAIPSSGSSSTHGKPPV